MTDIINIGLRVNSSDIKTGTDRLVEMGSTGVKTEARLNVAAKGMRASFGDLKQQIDLVTASIVALAAGAGINAAINANKEFEKSVSSLSAITGATGDDLEYYKQQAAEIGRTTTLSASQAVEAFKLIASAKPDLLSNAEALSEVTKQAVILAEASGGTLTLADAAEALGKSLNQFNLDASKSVDVVNLLAEASRAGTAGVALVSESLKNVGATANGMNVSLTETVAGIEALAKSGLDGAEAGTALRQILSKLEKTADKELQPSVVGLVGAIENLSKRSLSSIELMNMFGEEAQTAAASILAQKDTLVTLANSLDGTNTAYKQASTNVNNLDGDLKALNSVVESLQIGFGEELNPAMRASVQTLTDVLKNTDALSDAITAVSVVLGASAVPGMIRWTTALGANIAESLLAIPTNARMTASIFAYTGSVTTATVATNALTIATRTLLGPWGLVAAAVGTAIAVFVSSKSKVDELNASLDKQKESLGKVTKAYGELTEAGKESARFQLVDQINNLRQQSISARMEIQKLKKDLVFQDAGGRAQVNSRINELEQSVVSLDKQAEQASATLNKLTNSDLNSGWKSLGESSNEVKESVNAQIEALKKLQEQIGLTDDQLFVYQQRQKSIANGDSPALTAQIEAQAKAYIDAKNAHESMLESWTGQDKVSESALQAAKDYDDWVDSISTTSTELQRLQDEIDKTRSAIAKGDLTPKVGNEYITDLTKQINELNGPSGLEQLATSASTVLGSLSNLFESGSKDAQTLVVAIQAINTTLAVTKAITDASTGNIVGAISAGIGLLASADQLLNKELTADYEDIQQNQFLNIWGEKTESISASTELTASISKKLLGVNEDMLKALNNLTNAIASASGIVIQGMNATSLNTQGNFKSNAWEYLFGSNAEDILSGDLSSIFGDNFITQTISSIFGSTLGSFSGLLSNTIGKLLGGSSKVSDEGIKIIGGYLSDLIDDVTVQAYQTIKYKKWRWGSTKKKTSIATLSDAVSNQISLVFDSIGDAVATAASTLGYSDSYIQSMLDSFVVSTKTISTKGMSSSQQTEALNQYFSSIFDSLAQYVLPIVSEFTQTGEDFATTLTRLANQVAVADKITDIFGTTFGKTVGDPEAYITAADNLATLAGGVEDLADQVSSFFDSFATDAQKQEVYYDTLTEALSEVGLSLPKTASGLYDLMSSLDGSTESGQEQIAVLLSLTDTASAYYDLLDDSTSKYQDAIDSMYELSDATKTASLEAAIAAAQIGDFTLADALDLSSIAPDASNYSSLLDYNLARAETTRQLNELTELTNGTTSVSEQQLSVLEEIRDSLTNNATMDSSAITNELTSLRQQMNTLQTTTNQYLQQMIYGAITVRVEA